jgi:hypothetical protein
MTRRLLVLLVLRITGIVLAVRAVVGMLQTLGFLNYLIEADASADRGSWMEIGLQVTIVTAVTGSIALACLLNAEWVARKLFPEFDDREVPISADSLGPLAFRLLGVASLLWAAPGIVTAVLEVFWNLGGDRQVFLASFLAERWSDYAGALVAAVTGWIVFARAEQLAAPSRRVAPPA